MLTVEPPFDADPDHTIEFSTVGGPPPTPAHAYNYGKVANPVPD
jgi:hypothetical protein